MRPEGKNFSSALDHTHGGAVSNISQPASTQIKRQQRSSPKHKALQQPPHKGWKEQAHTGPIDSSALCGDTFSPAGDSTGNTNHTTPSLEAFQNLGLLLRGERGEARGHVPPHRIAVRMNHSFLSRVRIVGDDAAKAVEYPTDGVHVRGIGDERVATMPSVPSLWWNLRHRGRNRGGGDQATRRGEDIWSAAGG